MHLGLAAELVDIAEELALVGPDGLAKALIVAEDGAETERENGRVLEAVGNDPGVVYAGLLVQSLCGVMFAHDHGQVAGRIKEDLVATDAVDGFHRNWFAVASYFRKSLFFTDAVGIPCHVETLRARAPVSAGRW
jgi:hypothetical protein